MAWHVIRTGDPELHSPVLFFRLALPSASLALLYFSSFVSVEKRAITSF
jgi:hypothetical protein